MADVEAVIEEEFGKRIQACERLYEYAKSLTKPWSGHGLEDTADGLIVALFTRSLDTFKAVNLLARSGYGTQGAMLNRSMFEDMIDAHWVASDPETATQRYEDHHQHGRMLLADAVRKYPEQYGDMELPEFDEDGRKRLDVIYMRWGSKPWSAINLHQRVKLVEDQWTDEASRKVLWFFHDIAHRENNQTLHVSAASLNANVRLSEDNDNLVFSVGPRDDMIDRALFGGWWILQQTIGLLLERFESN